jgi:30S ribosomal protein 3
MDKNIGVAVDQVYSKVREVGGREGRERGERRERVRKRRARATALSFSVASHTTTPKKHPLKTHPLKQGQRAPLTEYYMWPRKDAWEELKAALEAKPWVPGRDRVTLLNRTTEVINFWQDDAAKHTVEEARDKFPDCTFSSS